MRPLYEAIEALALEAPHYASKNDYATAFAIAYEHEIDHLIRIASRTPTVRDRRIFVCTWIERLQHSARSLLAEQGMAADGATARSFVRDAWDRLADRNAPVAAQLVNTIEVTP